MFVCFLVNIFILNVHNSPYPSSDGIQKHVPHVDCTKDEFNRLKRRKIMNLTVIIYKYIIFKVFKDSLMSQLFRWDSSGFIALEHLLRTTGKFFNRNVTLHS